MTKGRRGFTGLGAQAELQNVLDGVTQRRFESGEVNVLATNMEIAICDSAKHPVMPAVALESASQKRGCLRNANCGNVML
jgi:hypothetical protein